LADVDYLTVSTTKLIDVYGQIRTHRPIPVLMENMIDPAVWRHPRAAAPYPARNRESGGGVKFVWWGGITHYKDLVKELLPAWLEVVKKYPTASLTTFGMLMDDLDNVPGVEQREGAGNFYKWIELWKSLDFDVAVLPLADIPFNESKSNIKWQEASMAKLPVVASNVGPYARTIYPGKTGLVAKDIRQWVEHLTAMIEQPNLRRQLAEAAHKEVVEKWMVNRIVPRYGEFVRGVLTSDRPWVDEPALSDQNAAG
jgi:glycosyltransferase involved in cell wall biosynthesis